MHRLPVYANVSLTVYGLNVEVKKTEMKPEKIVNLSDVCA
jgi:hypothetical protein